MGREEIWDLMTTVPLLAQEDSDWLVSMYADILGQLAAKLTEDELFSLLAIGTAFHQQGRRQKEAKLLADSALQFRQIDHLIAMLRGQAPD